MIYVVPNLIKEKLLKKATKLRNVKYMTLEELINKFTFSYSKKAVYYLMKKLDIKYEVALVYLESMKYLDDEKTYFDSKLKFLKKLKDELYPLLNIDKYFSNYINNKTIIFYGYSYIPKFVLSKLSSFNIETKRRKVKNFKVYEFITLEDEVAFVAGEIAKLISGGININNIKLICGEEYFFTIDKIFKFYNIPVNIPKKVPLYYTNEGKKALQNIALRKTENPKIAEILNEYYWCENLEEVKELIEYDLKHHFKEEVEYENAVSIESIENNEFNSDDYCFLLGFNEGKYPKVYYDEDYLSDKLKEKLNLETSKELNIIFKESIITSLSNINNLIISYKLESPFEKYYPSILIQELNMDVIRNIKKNYNYSHLYNKLELSRYLDDLIKYNAFHNDLVSLYSTYQNINYGIYDHKFTGIDLDDLDKRTNKKLTLSYTAIDKYYQCEFKYYLSHILKLEEKESTLSLIIGNVFHYVLSKAFLDSFDFDEVINKYLLDRSIILSPKEHFLLNNLLGELKFAIDTINKQMQHINYDKALYEEKVIVNIANGYDVTFIGVIDKILYKEIAGKVYLALIDYKTGNASPALDNILDGLNLQLPVYLFLVRNIDKFMDAEVYGFYLQPILGNAINIENKKSYEEQKHENLKLVGYSVSSIDSEGEFISLSDKSKIVKGLKEKKDGGYYSYAKVLTKEEIDKVCTIAKEKIYEAIENITKGQFRINPKVIDKENVSCKYCKFSDICYKNESDLVYLKKTKHFLGDDYEVD